MSGPCVGLRGGVDDDVVVVAKSAGERSVVDWAERFGAVSSRDEVEVLADVGDDRSEGDGGVGEVLRERRPVLVFVDAQHGCDVGSGVDEQCSFWNAADFRRLVGSDLGVILMGSGLKYSLEFRVEAVRLVTEFSRSLVDVAAEVGVSKDTLKSWVRQARLESMTAVDVDAAKESREMKLLAKRVAELEMENAFLKKAAAFFAAEQAPRNGTRS